MSKDITTRTTTFDDGKHLRTALVIAENNKCGSIDLVYESPEGNARKRIAQVNIFLSDDGATLIVDVIDIEHQYKVKTAIAFPDKRRAALNVGSGNLVSADFRNGPGLLRPPSGK